MSEVLLSDCETVSRVQFKGKGLLQPPLLPTEITFSNQTSLLQITASTIYFLMTTCLNDVT